MSYMSDFGATAADNGYSIIPIAPGSKRPGKFSDGTWYAMNGWTRFCDRVSRTFEHTIWSKWPESGVGIACGRTVAVDIDVLDQAWASKLETLARKMLGETPLLRVGQAPKRMLVYKAKTSFPGIKYHPIEILAKGQQFVAFADHPETNRPYQWIGESPCEIDIDDLPEVSEEQCRKFAEAAHKILPDELKPQTIGAGTGCGDTSLLGVRGTIEGIESALDSISNDDLTWDDWFAVGCSIKGAIGENGRSIFFDWSAQSCKHDDKVTAKLWKSLKPPFRKGAGSLYHMASANGWVPPAEITLNGDIADMDPVDPSSIINGPSKLTPPTKPAPRNNLAGIVIPPYDPSDPPLPEDPAPQRQIKEQAHIEPFLEVPGIVGGLTKWITDSAISPQPFLALGATLAAVGALMGRRYRTTTNLRSNLYVVGVAGSGGGKDHPRGCLQKAFYEAGLFQYMGGNKIASGQAILSALHRHPSMIFQLDEFGHLLNQILSKRAAAHHAQIWSTLTELYTSAGGFYQGTEYANQKEKPREDISQPCACLNATTVPGPLWQALENGAMSDGSLARFLIFRSPVDYPDRNKGGISDPPETVVEGLKRIAVGVPDHDYGGDVAKMMVANSNPRPYTVPLTKSAEAKFDQLERDQIANLRDLKNSPKSSVIARKVENTAKLAMIYAASECPEKPVVSDRAVDWASSLVEHCIGTLLVDADRYLADTPIQASLKRASRIIEEEKRMTKTQYTKRTQWADKRTREEVLTTLVDSGTVALLKTDPGSNGGRPSIEIVWIGDNSESGTIH